MKKHIIFFVLAISPVNAGIYKWTDKNGNVHFGDRPANQDTATELNIQTDNATGFTNSSGNKKEREYLLKKIEEEKKTDAEQRKKLASEDKKRRDLCNDYRSRLQTHIQYNRTYTVAADGERTYLNDKQRADRKNKLSKGITKYCR